MISIKEHILAVSPEPFLDMELEPDLEPQWPINQFPGEFTRLSHRLFLNLAASERKVVAFIGCDKHAPTSSVCRTASQMLAFETGKSVCMIDIVERSPASPRLLEGKRDRSAISELEEALLRPEAVRKIAHNLGKNLWSVPATQDGSPDLPPFSNASIAELTNQIRAQFDYAMIAAAPLALNPSSIALCAASDGVVVVLDGQTTRTAAEETVHLLKGLDIPIAGAVLDQASVKHPC